MKKPLIISILDVGLSLWVQGGIRNVTHRGIAAIIGRNPSGVLYHFDYKMENLRDAVAKHAVETECVPVVLQLLAANHPATASLSQEDRAAYVAIFVLANPGTI